MIFITIADIVSWICNLLIILLLIRSVLSWFAYSGSQRGSTLGQIFQLLIALTEPIIMPVRRLLGRFVNTGPIDLAPLVTFFVIMLVRRVLVSILYMLAF